LCIDLSLRCIERLKMFIELCVSFYIANFMERKELSGGTVCHVEEVISPYSDSNNVKAIKCAFQIHFRGHGMYH
jgi:hypothetical protein